MNNSEKILREFISNKIDIILSEAFKFKNDNESFIPPTDVSKVAKRAGVVYQNLKDSGQAKNIKNSVGGDNEGSGKRKFAALSAEEPQSHSELKRLYSFFKNNEQQVSEERKKLGISIMEKGLEKEMKQYSLLLIWNLHGGDQCYKWVSDNLDRKNKENLTTKKNQRVAGGANTNKGMGTSDVTMMDPTKMRIHR